MRVYDRAIGAVGRLDGVTTILPSTPLLIYMYIRKEPTRDPLISLVHY